MNTCDVKRPYLYNVALPSDVAPLSEEIFAYTIDSRYKVARITKRRARVCNKAELMAAAHRALAVDANADNN